MSFKELAHRFSGNEGANLFKAKARTNAVLQFGYNLQLAAKFSFRFCVWARLCDKLNEPSKQDAIHQSTADERNNIINCSNDCLVWNKVSVFQTGILMFALFLASFPIKYWNTVSLLGVYFATKNASSFTVAIIALDSLRNIDAAYDGGPNWFGCCIYESLQFW